MIKTDLNSEWETILRGLEPDQRAMLLDAAEDVANGLKTKSESARISTNGALEILFAIGCWQNRERSTEL